MPAPIPPRFFTDQDLGDSTPTLRDPPVVLWRFDCLERAGYPAAVAVLLAKDARVDLHDAVELLKRGCSLETAVDILL